MRDGTGLDENDRAVIAADSFELEPGDVRTPGRREPAVAPARIDESVTPTDVGDHIPHEMPRKALTALALGLAGALLAAPAGAVPVGVSFTGMLGFVPPELSSAFATNDPVSGSFVVDPESDASVDPDLGQYEVTDIVFHFGGYTATDPGGGGDFLRVDNATLSAADKIQLVVAGPVGADVGGFSLLSIGLDLTDPTATALDDDAIPGSVDLGEFVSAVASLQFQNGSILNVNATLETFIVPEPATLPLVLTGALGLAAARRSRRG